MIEIGIDPGNTGALVVIEGDCLSIHDTPTIKDGKKTRIDESACAKILSEIKASSVSTNGFVTVTRPVMATVEKVHAMRAEGRQQGGSSMFTFGYGFGVWMGILAALKIPHQLVTPQAWKKEMFAGYSPDTDSRVVARRLWPVQTEETLSRKKDHGRADALLIAEFGRRLQGRKA